MGGFGLRRRYQRGYEQGGAPYLRRALIAQLGLGLIVGLAGALLTLTFVRLSFSDLVVIVLLAELSWAVEGAIRIPTILRGLEPFERWATKPGEEGARAAWDGLAELPFRVLRQRLPLVIMPVLIVLWDVVGVRLVGLSFSSFIFFLPGSLLVWLYAMALRFFAMEVLIRPALADTGSHLPDGGGSSPQRITLSRRLLVVVPAITIIAGTIVAGLVGERDVRTVAIGAGVSAAVALAISSWLVGLLADSIATPIGEIREAADRVGGGDLDVKVPVVSVDETGALARSFNSMVEGLRERERIREAFGTYVDPEVAEHVLREGTDLAGEMVEVTIMFVDIRGFTSYSESADASTVVGTLNRLFGRLVPIIRDHGGHVDKFVGDGLMAVFGAPRRQADHADRAFAAALQVGEAVKDEFGSDLEVGIGLNSGNVVAGNVGGEGRLEFSVIGDAVNVAARVESATRQTGDQILIAGATRDLLSSARVPLDERIGVKLKGKSEVVRLFAPTQPHA